MLYIKKRNTSIKRKKELEPTALRNRNHYFLWPWISYQFSHCHSLAGQKAR